MVAKKVRARPTQEPGAAHTMSMADGNSKEDFRRRRLSLADQDPSELAKAAAGMSVTPDKAAGGRASAPGRRTWRGPAPR